MVGVSVKKFSLVLIGLVLLLPISVAATTQPHDNPSILYDVDIWIDSLNYRSFSVTCDEGDAFAVAFQVTSGPGVNFFVCDDENFDKFTNLEESSAYLINYDVGSLDRSMTIPRDDTWHVVFVNTDLLYQVHVVGTFTVRSGTASSAAGLLLILALGGLLVVIIVGNNMRNKDSKHVSYQQPKSPQHSSYSYCPYCGNPNLPFRASFCSKCGKSLGEPPGIA